MRTKKLSIYTLLSGSLVVLFAISSCSNLETKKIPLSERKLLFPYGKYKTLVTVFQKDKERDFKAIFQNSAEKNTFSGVGALATSLFKIEEEKPSGKITVEIFQSRLKNFEDQLRQSYTKLSNLLSFSILENVKPPHRLLKKDTDNFPIEIDVDEGQDRSKIIFVSYDENKIPKEINIENKELNLKIEMLSYKLDGP